MLEQAEKALQMSVNLTSQLLTFSKGGKPVAKKIALRPVIENSVKFALSGSRVDYRLQFEEELWKVEGGRGTDRTGNTEPCYECRSGHAHGGYNNDYG